MFQNICNVKFIQNKTLVMSTADYVKLIKIWPKLGFNFVKKGQKFRKRF